MSLLQVSGLGKSFGGVTAVDGIELRARRRRAAGADRPERRRQVHHLQHGQRPAARRPRLDQARRRRSSSAASRARSGGCGVGRTFQIAETFASLTVVENVQMALLSHDRQLFSIWRRAADHRRDDALALLEQVGMKPQAERPCSVLAYGDVKRVELAIAMANAPKLLLMDEPTAGMAPKERNALMALTKHLVDRARHGGAVHRAQHGRGLRLCRPHDRAGARPPDRAGQAARDPRRIRRCRRSTSAAARPSRRRRRRPAHERRRHPARGQGAVRLVRRRADPLRRRPRGRGAARWWR